MKQNEKVDAFLSKYEEQVFNNVLKLRKVLFANLPDIIEQIDLPAKMIAYCYGQKYVEMICTIIPSKKGIKLAFYNGIDLPDPDNLLEGSAKLSRYVEIKSNEQINSNALKQLIVNGLKAHKERMSLK